MGELVILVAALALALAVAAGRALLDGLRRLWPLARAWWRAPALPGQRYEVPGLGTVTVVCDDSEDVIYTLPDGRDVSVSSRAFHRQAQLLQLEAPASDGALSLVKGGRDG